MRVKLECELCGVITEIQGHVEVLNYAIDSLTEEHWEEVHPYPNIRYKWSTDD